MKDSGSARNERPDLPPFRFESGVVTLSLHVQPGAAKTEWAGWHGVEAIKLKLTAPPVDGKANRACIKFAAKTFDVPIRNVSIVRGEKSRSKSVVIQDVSFQKYDFFRKQWGSK